MEKKIVKVSVLVLLEIGTSRDKNVWKPRPSGVILVPSRVFSENFRRAPLSFSCGSAPRGVFFLRQILNLTSNIE